ncbi:hypothetical protein DSECCO2_630230 [anaerobic digester metagenome]
MPPLCGALAFKQVYHIAVLVAEYLNFDVPRTFDELFDVHRAVAEVIQCFARGIFKGLFKFPGCADDAHALSAAAGCRFDKHGKPDLIVICKQIIRVTGNPRGNRNTQFNSCFACGNFIPHRPDRSCRGPDKGDAFAFAGF